MDAKQVKGIAKKEVKAHEKRMHGATKMAKGDRKSTRLNSSH